LTGAAGAVLPALEGCCVLSVDRRITRAAVTTADGFNDSQANIALQRRLR